MTGDVFERADRRAHPGKSHLYRESAVKRARRTDADAEHTGKPVPSVCGMVRSYGPFEATDGDGDDGGEGRCAVCIERTDVLRNAAESN